MRIYYLLSRQIIPALWLIATVDCSSDTFQFETVLDNVDADGKIVGTVEANGASLEVKAGAVETSTDISISCGKPGGDDELVCVITPETQVFTRSDNVLSLACEGSNGYYRVDLKHAKGERETFAASIACEAGVLRVSIEELGEYSIVPLFDNDGDSSSSDLGDSTTGGAGGTGGSSKQQDDPFDSFSECFSAEDPGTSGPDLPVESNLSVVDASGDFAGNFDLGDTVNLRLSAGQIQIGNGFLQVAIEDIPKTEFSSCYFEEDEETPYFSIEFEARVPPTEGGESYLISVEGGVVSSNGPVVFTDAYISKAGDDEGTLLLAL